MNQRTEDPRAGEVEIAPCRGRRGVYRLRTSLVLPAPIDEVFAFFSDAYKLERITPPWLRFEVWPPGPGETGPGCLIDYKLRLHGIPIRWRSEIATWEPPHRFVDRQVRGPYRLWHHEHVFEPRGSGTLCQDEVHYAVPGGRLIHWLLVKRDVRRIFEYRQEQLLALFPSKPRER